MPICDLAPTTSCPNRLQGCGEGGGAQLLLRLAELVAAVELQASRPGDGAPCAATQLLDAAVDIGPRLWSEALQLFPRDMMPLMDEYRCVASGVGEGAVEVSRPGCSTRAPRMSANPRLLSPYARPPHAVRTPSTRPLPCYAGRQHTRCRLCWRRCERGWRHCQLQPCPLRARLPRPQRRRGRRAWLRPRRRWTN